MSWHLGTFRVVTALTPGDRRTHRGQPEERREAGEAWQDNDLVFCHQNGAPYTSDQLNWRFSKMTRRAGIGRWHAHEGRHTAASIMSSNGVPLTGHQRHATGLPDLSVEEVRLPSAPY